MTVVARRHPQIPCPAPEHHPHTYVCADDMCPGWFLAERNIFHSRGITICCSCNEVWPCDVTENHQGGTA